MKASLFAKKDFDPNVPEAINQTRQLARITVSTVTILQLVVNYSDDNNILAECRLLGGGIIFFQLHLNLGKVPTIACRKYTWCATNEVLRFYGCDVRYCREYMSTVRGSPL